MRISTLGIVCAGMASSLIGAVLLTPLAVAAAPAVTTPKGIFPAQTYAGVGVDRRAIQLHRKYLE
jgi:hypothetical protein